MNICIVIPVYNEEAFLPLMLSSVVEQTQPPQKVVLVNDGSTDGSQRVMDSFAAKYEYIESIHLKTEGDHQPGSKVIRAFQAGIQTLDATYDLIGKFDADIILPASYFEEMRAAFEADEQLGMASGNLYIEKNSDWVFEKISEKTKIRGPIKLYRRECFEAMGGLKESIGWDTADQFLAAFHGWTTRTLPHLHVKHLKPTGANYNKAAKGKQGMAFKRLRYGWLLSAIASAKLAWNKKSIRYFFDCMQGYASAKNHYIVSKEEGVFIRNLRWKLIRKKLY